MYYHGTDCHFFVQNYYRTLGVKRSAGDKELKKVRLSFS